MGKLQFCDVAGLEFHNSGPQWGEESDQLDVTVLSWENGRGLEAQINHELDVVFVVLQGEGIATVAGEEIALRPGVVLPIPKGVERAVKSTAERLTYASIHQRRRGLMPKL